MTSFDILRSLGAEIRSLRENRKLSQREVGQRIGIGAKYVSEIERATRDIPFSTLYAVVERGLQLRLDIAIREKAAARAAQLPSSVEELAALIAQLPIAKRTRVIDIVRALLELERISKTTSANSGSSIGF